ncbi:hypothetical protein ACA086_12375 [Muriicola sp. E247]|uniref:hypothetical protein n=1 Tax=Muriicola sp. E247 TaxID=3242730 RepID=UPI003525FD9A
MVKYLSLFLILILFFSCNTDKTPDCSLVLCAAGDAIRLELINNGENIISNGTYTESNISISRDESENLRIRVLSDVQGATSGLLELNNFDWQPGEYAYTVELENDWVINLSVTFGLTGNDPCCGDRLEITTLSAGNFTVEQLPNSGFYTIILE